MTGKSVKCIFVGQNETAITQLLNMLISGTSKSMHTSLMGTNVIFRRKNHRTSEKILSLHAKNIIYPYVQDIIQICRIPHP